jgi:hypothetical protein
LRAGGKGVGGGEERGGGRSPMMIVRATSAAASVQLFVFRVSGLGFRFSVSIFHVGCSMHKSFCRLWRERERERGRKREEERERERARECVCVYVRERVVCVR